MVQENKIIEKFLIKKILGRNLGGILREKNGTGKQNN